MRKAFAETLTELAREDDRILLLTADLGFQVLEPFANAFPGRFFNVGVAEQNMVGIATGLAEAGFLPFTYSIVTFAVLRPFEFIRNGPVAHRLPVRIVSVGGGLEYGHNGLTHYGLEDIGVLRTQPGLPIICPCDVAQAREAIRQTCAHPTPLYYRLSKDDRLSIPELRGKFVLGCPDAVLDGGDLAIVAIGNAAADAMTAARMLREQGVGCAAILVSSITSDTTAHLSRLLRGVPRVIAVEAHSVNGGLGSLVAEAVAEGGLGCTLVRCGVRGLGDGRSGSQAFMHELHGISPQAIVRTALQLLAGPAR